LRVTVRDNGVGVQAAAPSEGVGLSNTRARLEQLYGTQGEFTIENVAPKGCLARLEIPFHAQPLVRAIPS
jgi:signal transduction histidine kinase